MTTPVVQIDDRNQLVFFSPNSSWIRGGAAGDFDGTSTLTSATGASATLTFTGSGISVWGTIQFLQPNTPTYVLSSYSINGGPTTFFNATETTAFQFQQKLFQSDTLPDNVPHTIVVTLVNNATFFIDYFLIIPPSSSSSSSSASSSSAASGITSVATLTIPTLSSTTTSSAGAQSNPSTRVSLGAAVGGSLGGFALVLVIAFLAVFFCRKRRNTKNQIQHDLQVQEQPVPFVTPASSMQQYHPHEGSDRVSEHRSYSHSQYTSPITSSSSGVILPSSKAAQLSIPTRSRRDSLHSRPFSDSPEPPRYDE